jgi:hypothetical protein
MKGHKGFPRNLKKGGSRKQAPMQKAPRRGNRGLPMPPGY